MEQAVECVGFDDVLVALGDVQRRELIESLEHNQQKDPPVVISGTETKWSPLSVSMHHVHLPKLADAGLIEWDSEIQVVRKGPKFEKVRPVLRALLNYREELPRVSSLKTIPPMFKAFKTTVDRFTDDRSVCSSHWYDLDDMR